MDIFKKNKYIASVCATKIGSGFQNKITDYLNLKVPVLTNIILFMDLI